MASFWIIKLVRATPAAKRRPRLPFPDCRQSPAWAIALPQIIHNQSLRYSFGYKARSRDPLIRPNGTDRFQHTAAVWFEWIGEKIHPPLPIPCLSADPDLSAAIKPQGPPVLYASAVNGIPVPA